MNINYIKNDNISLNQINWILKSILSVLIFVLFSLQIVYAATVNVSTISALQTAVNSSSPGDIIILANGTYTNNTLTVANNNITVKSATAGGVYLTGTNAITISGSYVTFTGFQFTSGIISGNAVTLSGNYNTLTQLNFNGYDAGHMVYITGANNILSYSNFQNKPASNLVNHGGTGDMVQIIPNSAVIGYNTIRYCSFQQMPGFGGDYGNECIRIGDGSYSTIISRTVVEYCYFENTGRGDSEAISVKSQENCLRFNTMNNNPDAMFSFRNGDNNKAYSNFFIKSGGIRCKQSNNIFIYNNYFSESAVGQNSSLPGTSKAPIYLEYFGSGFGNNFNIINNTFYKCTASEIDNNLTNCTWANNIFYSFSSTIFTGTTSGQTFVGNIYQGSLGLTISSGMNNTNPLLALNSDNYYGLSATSPAIDASNSSYPTFFSIANINDDATMAFDIQGQSRPTSIPLKDVGCDEYTTGTITNRPLALSDTGPSYLVIYLPVKLTSFEASLENQKQVNLVWKTASETNNNYFVIAKSVDGITFSPFAKVPSKGNGSTYNTVDFEPIAGISYYKLSQTDLDGKTDVLGIRTVKVANLNQADLVVYPNPVVNGIINIKSLDLNGSQDLAIYDLAGKKLVSDKINFIYSNATYKIKENIAKGVYILKIGSEKISSRIIIQ